MKLLPDNQSLPFLRQKATLLASAMGGLVNAAESNKLVVKKLLLSSRLLELNLPTKARKSAFCQFCDKICLCQHLLNKWCI